MKYYFFIPVKGEIPCLYRTAKDYHLQNINFIGMYVTKIHYINIYIVQSASCVVASTGDVATIKHQNMVVVPVEKSLSKLE